MTSELLKGKTVLITGSSRGIGSVTAKLAKKNGARVFLHGKTKSDSLIKLVADLDAEYIFCDVGNESEVINAIKKLDRIDVLINNAGIQISKPFLELSEEDWMDVFSTNILGVINFSKAAIPKMEKGGRIINISSAKAYPATAGRSAYASLKAALNQLTICMAKEFSDKGILVNAVAPGFVGTEMTAETMSKRIKKQIDDSLLKRMAKPEEIAEAILWLASDKSSFVIGQTLLVDGGFSLSIK